MGREAYVTERTLGAAVRRWERAIGDYHRRRPLGSLDRAALIVVDMQHAFADPRGEAFLPASRAALPRILALRDAFRSAGLPVAFTRHGHRRHERSGSMARHWIWLILEGSPQSRLLPDLAPRRDEPVFRKAQYSAFRGTRLETWLRRRGVERLVVAGVMTHLCVETTAREAFLREMDAIVPIDACASADETLHLGALRALSNGFALVPRTGDLLRVLRSEAAHAGPRRTRRSPS